ncbi:MAG TPA: DUF6538 domain-containing protein [Pseudorhizobium sp.]|jgi:integrase|nr:DUF6538 domain-containing protein [Pseudorhizobium sp.]
MATPRINRLGIFTARLWVPTDLQPVLKKKEVVRSLKTRDPAEAKRKFKIVVAEFEAECEQLRTVAEFVATTDSSMPAPRTITEKEAHALSGEIYRTMVAAHEENPGSVENWENRLRSIQRSLPRAERDTGCVAPFVQDKGWAFHPTRNAHRELSGEVRAFLDARNDNLEARSFMLLCSKVALAKRDAYERLLRHARGDFAPDPKADRFPTPAVSSRPEGPETGCEELLAKWKDAAGVADKTVKSWSGKLRMLMKFSGKTDVAALTRDDVARWRDHRIGQGISMNTVSMGDLAGVRAILEWAKDSTLTPTITINAAAEVKQKTKKVEQLGPKSFELHEANAILAATLLPPAERMTRTGAMARRWVPWLCAYSGARVGEVGQLHSSNVFEKLTVDGRRIWCMRLTPEHGSIKSGEARTVPIHTHVLEQGFLDYVAERRGKPLFYDPARARGSKQNHRQADKVGERLALWVREEVGITRKVQPNHGWRHRFETQGRELDIRQDVVDKITGHKNDTQAAEYGDYLIPVLSAAIENLPRYLSTADMPACSRPEEDTTGGTVQPAEASPFEALSNAPVQDEQRVSRRQAGHQRKRQS